MPHRIKTLLTIFLCLLSIFVVLSVGEGRTSNWISMNRSEADLWQNDEVVKLRAADRWIFDDFGCKVTINGDILVIGDCTESGGVDNPVAFSGTAYIYYRDRLV